VANLMNDDVQLIAGARRSSGGHKPFDLQTQFNGTNLLSKADSNTTETYAFPVPIAISIERQILGNNSEFWF
jgi:hypothetical protein